MVHTEEEQVNSFRDVERVVADSLRFKRKLAIGEDAYASMRVGKGLGQLWDVGGIAVTGGQIAASATVARTFFASGGLLSTIGLGAAAVTPAIWVVGTALVTAGAYYGVTRLFKTYSGSRVEVIPKFINTPIDLLGASLMDFLGALSLKIAHMDGQVTSSERQVIQDYFIEEWGFDRNYSESALVVIEENSSKASIADITTAFASFARANPDCNFEAMRREVLSFLREVSVADGAIDEREELAIDKIDLLLRKASTIVPTVSLLTAIPAQANSMAGRLLKKLRKIGKSDDPPAIE